MYYNNNTGAQLQAMQYSNPMYNQYMQNGLQQPNQPYNSYPQQPQQYNNIPEKKFGSSPTHDFFGKRVSSFQEVKDCPVPMDGKPMLFIDDENEKLYFKFMDGTGSQTVQSFTITSDNSSKTEAPIVKQEANQSMIDTNLIIAKVEEISKNFVTIDDFTRLKKEFESLKEGLI